VTNMLLLDDLEVSFKNLMSFLVPPLLFFFLFFFFSSSSSFSSTWEKADGF
jgi:hypothetical protein